MIPAKLVHGDKFSDIPGKINEILEYLRRMQPVAGAGIRLQHTPSGVIISSTAPGQVTPGEEESVEYEE